MRILACLTLAFALSGCANFSNRLVVTPSCDRAYMLSLYWKVGISSELAEADAAAVCAAKGGK